MFKNTRVRGHLPQNRERVYIVFIRDDQDIEFNFNFDKKELVPLYKILEKDDYVDNINQSTKDKIISQFSNIDIIKNEQSSINREINEKVVCLNSKNKEGKQPSQQYRVYSKSGLMTTLSSQLNGRYNVISNLGHVRKITPREAYLLQGFSENDFNKVKYLPSNSLFYQAGNTISVPVLEEIFKNIFKDFNFKEESILTNENMTINIDSCEQLTFDLF